MEICFSNGKNIGYKRGNNLMIKREKLIKGNTVCLKKHPRRFSCNFRKHCWIFIMFGTHVTEKVSNQQLL